MLVTVPSTVTKMEGDGKSKKSFTAFLISVEIEDALSHSLHKRYSQLHRFNSLCTTYLTPELKQLIPPFPSKSIGALNTASKERRREKIETYLKVIVETILPELLKERETTQSEGSEAISVIYDFLEIQQKQNPTLPANSVLNDEAAYDSERKNKLMEMSSVVGGELVRIYYLDCTFKTVRFSQDTTVGDVVREKISPNVQFSLFESDYDVRLPSMTRIDDATRIVDIIHKWKSSEEGIKRQKFLAPIPSGVDLSFTASAGDQAKNATAVSRHSSVVSDTATRGSTQTLGTVATLGSTVTATAHQLNNDLESSFISGSPPRNTLERTFVNGTSTYEEDERLTLLRIDHDALLEKYDLLKNMLKKRGRDRALSLQTSARLEDRGEGKRRFKKVGKDDVILRGWLEKLSDYKKIWNKRYFILKGNGTLLYFYSEPTSETQIAADSKTCVDLNEVTRIVRASRELAFTIMTKGHARIVLQANAKKSFNDWFKTLTDLKDEVTGDFGGVDLDDGDDDGFDVMGEVSDGKAVTDDNIHVVIEQDDLDHIDFKNIAVEDSVDYAGMNGTVRKKTKTTGITARSFLNKVTALDRFFFTFDRDYMQQLFKQASKSPDHMTQACEVVSAMQIMYCNALSFGERWTQLFRRWILINLKENLNLPVQRPDLLMSVVHCLKRERMLKNSDTIREVEECIELMFTRGEEEEEEEVGEVGEVGEVEEEGEKKTHEEVKHLLRCVKSMIDTLYCVIDDLVPMLPSDFNVLTLFQKAAEKRIQLKVGVFYASHKDDLNVDELLTLLSWADNHKHVMARFGVLDMSKEFVEIEADLYKKYSTEVQGLQLQWQDRIIENESSFSVGTKSDGSKLSNWPEDLMMCVEKQLNLAITRLQGKNLCPICCLCVDTIDVFKIALQKKIKKERGDMGVEDMCCFANDCYRFADLLQEQTVMLDNLDEEAADEVGDKMGELIMHFSELSSNILNSVVEVFSVDVEKELISAMLADDSSFANNYTQSANEMETVSKTMHNLADNIKIWLSDDSLLVFVLKHVIKRLVKCYIETLLSAQPTIDEFGEVMRQIRDDAVVLENCFLAYEQLLPQEMIEKELTALLQVIQYLEMETDDMVDYWMSKLVKTFGSSSVKVVESVLNMRGLWGEEKGKAVMTGVKELNGEHGANLIHDDKCGFLLNIKVTRVRKRDLIKEKIGKGDGTKKKVFMIRKASSSFVSTEGSDGGSPRAALRASRVNTVRSDSGNVDSDNSVDNTSSWNNQGFIENV